MFVCATSTIRRKFLTGYKRRIAFDNKRIFPAKLAGQLRCAALVVWKDIDFS